MSAGIRPSRSDAMRGGFRTVEAFKMLLGSDPGDPPVRMVTVTPRPEAVPTISERGYGLLVALPGPAAAAMMRRRRTVL